MLDRVLDAQATLRPASGAEAGAATDALVAESAAMRRLWRELDALAPAHATVLLRGETGTGKGLVAREIHRRSRRAGEPFVHVDCAALAPSVIESELFGHERGAFTGAIARRIGRFEQAAAGTVFLDEIGDLALDLQAKLLRVLQDREYERVGGVETLPMRARVVAATSRDLRRAVRAGRFRADLFFRLRVVELRIPPLRERTADLPGLVRAGLARAARRNSVSPPPVHERFCARLESYAWPGNVRELLNLLERLLLSAGGAPLDAHHLDGLLEDEAAWGLVRDRAPDPGAAGGDRDVEKALASALIASGGNVSRAARRLRIPRSTLRYRISRYGLERLIPRD